MGPLLLTYYHLQHYHQPSKAKASHRYPRSELAYAPDVVVISHSSRFFSQEKLTSKVGSKQQQQQTQAAAHTVHII
jgi:hypothetical protein